jgi:hypothetical protein
MIGKVLLGGRGYRLWSPLAEKEALERELSGSEREPQKITALLRNLQSIARFSVGMLWLRWPGHPHPLYLRCGAADLSNFVQMFVNKEYEVPRPYIPSEAGCWLR